MSRYSLQRRPKGSRYSDIEDPAFRSRCISFASTGMSRRGVAAAVGKPESTIRGWVERGMAYPDIEPWGSFSVDYRRAERGIEGAAAGTVALTVQRLWELAKRAHAGDLDALRVLSENKIVERLLNLLESRWPEDWGQSKHRKPEPEHDGQHWLDAHAMDREQLKALFTDPPELIRLAMEDAGCWPPRGKDEDETRTTEKIR